MARHRGPRVIISPPAAPSPAKFDLADFLTRAAVVALCVVGFVAVARWVDGLSRPAPGWICIEVARITADDTRRDRRCEPAAGWHAERWPDGATVAVPDHALVVRRTPVRD